MIRSILSIVPFVLIVSTGLSAQEIRVSGYKYVKELQTQSERTATYGRLELDEEVIASSGTYDLRVVQDGRAVPHFRRRIEDTRGAQGSLRPEVVFTELIEGERVYVLRLPEIPAYSMYTYLEVETSGAYETTVSVQAGPKPEELAFLGHFSLYQYGGEAANSRIRIYGVNRREPAIYLRLRFQSDAVFYFPSVRYQSARQDAEYEQQIDLEEVEQERDSDLEATVYYIENPMQRRYHRMVLTFAERRFQRSVELQATNRESREYEYVMSGIVLSTDVQEADQILEFDRVLPGDLKLIIYDGDDAPLTLKSASLFVPREEIVVELPGETTGPLLLYYGNRYALAPDYDIDVTYDSGLNHVWLSAGDQSENPDFGYSVVEPPLSSWIIRVVFVLSLLGLAVPGYRILADFARRAKSRQES